MMSLPFLVYCAPQITTVASAFKHAVDNQTEIYSVAAPLRSIIIELHDSTGFIAALIMLIILTKKADARL